MFISDDVRTKQKVFIEFDLNDEFSKQDFNRHMHSLDMALALDKLRDKMRRIHEEDEKITDRDMEEVYELLDFGCHFTDFFS